MGWSSLFEYDPTVDGCLVWRINAGYNGLYYLQKIGQRVGSYREGVNSSGYYVVNIGGTVYKHHRIIFEMFNFTIPENRVINHIDCNTKNNKVENLEICSISENNRRRREHNGEIVRNKSVQLPTGVVLDSSGSPRIKCHWTEESVLRTKSFSIIKYGYEIAVQMAIEFRKSKIQELIGKGYGYR